VCTKLKRFYYSRLYLFSYCFTDLTIVLSMFIFVDVIEVDLLAYMTLIFFSETTGPFGTKFDRNVPWTVLFKSTYILLIWCTQKKQEVKGVKKVLAVLNLLWNHWANWNQTWYGCSLEGSKKMVWFFLLIGSTRMKQRPKVVKRGVFWFCMRRIYFLPILMCLFLYVPHKSK